ARNAVRRYEFEDLTTTPAVAQVGTVFDDAATRAASRQYFIPTITATGQGHAVVGFTMAGSVGATPAYTGRLAGDPAGTMAGPPALPATTFGTTTANYNPPVVPGSPRPWGRQSFTVVDPIDDMTVWTIQEYNQALNSYAVRVGRLNAPPPATPTCSGAALAFPGPTGNVVIAGTSMNGSGFYDPGANLPAPALPFAHIGATVTNAIVNSITYDSPTQVTLNITTLTTGLHDVTITNPDGQSVTGNGCIDAAAASSADLTLTKSDNGATVAAGGTVAYALTYGNAGDLDATNVTLNETVPTNTTFNAGASTPGWSCVPNDDPPSTCTLALGSVAAGVANQNATFAVTVDDPLPGGVTQISNTATISDDGTHGADPTPANNSASDMTTISGLPSVSGTKTVAGTFAVGSNVTYTIVLTNNGTGTQQDNAGNEFSDILPPEVTLVSANATNGAAVATVLTNTVTWNGALTAGASVTITITAVIEPVAVGTIITNQGTIAFDANGDATNESTAPTDDPSVGGATDATSFTVTAATVPGIPTLSVLGMALLIGLSLIAGVVLLKR
ncbi:MAG TPA: hypothetical protein VGQ76_09510, partial [Thermoanaerobaculia bacterium]|nr:hypothetical protein [Thermoanaerobaculia bacterium]